MKEEEERNSFSEEDTSDVLSRFKDSLITGKKKYFDVSEFEAIVEELMDEGDINTSEIAVLQGIQIHPDAVTLQLKYSQVLLSKGMYKKAMKYLELAEKVEVNNPDIHLMKGSAWLILGEDRAAEKSFVKAVKTADSDEDDILYHIGSAYVQAGEIIKAVDFFEKALLINPQNENALYELGFFSDQQGNFEKSIEYYNRFLDIDPFNYSIWFNLGITYNKAEKYEKAIEAYEFVLAINDQYHQALFNIANAHANAGNYRKAIKKYFEYIEEEPDNDDAFCYIGECYLNLEDYNISEKYYHKAIKINRENDTAWFGLGLIMWVEKKYAESVVFIRKAIKIDNSNPEYWLTLAKVYNDYNLPDEAGKALKKAVRLEPENSEIWLTWVDVLVKYGETYSAQQIIKTGIENSRDALLKYRLAGLLLEDKKEPEAVRVLEDAMEQDFGQINYLFEIYPKALKNKRVSRLINNFKGKLREN